MGKYGIATSHNVAPTGYALVNDEVWVNGVKQEVTKDVDDLDSRILAAGTVGAFLVAEANIIVNSPDTDPNG